MATAHVRTAARKALAEYLATRVTSGVKFYDRFPPPGEDLRYGAISVILAPAKDREHRFQAVKLSQSSVDNNTLLVKWSWGIVEFGLQIDVWSGFQAARDALILEVEAALNRPPGKTLGTGVSWQLDLAPGVVLQVADNFDTPCAYRFAAMPGTQEGGPLNQAGEWRATWMGSGTAHLIRQIQVAKARTIILREQGSGIDGTVNTVLHP